MARSQNVGITGCGKSIPQRLITNEILAKECKVEPGWIEERTGIRSRYYVGPAESASLLAARAAGRAIDNAGIKASDIGLVICCSYSGDYHLPPLACKIQHELKAERAGAFDLSSGSAGFGVALEIGAGRLKSDPSLKNILVVASAVQSPFLDKSNPATAILFGDGAAAAVLSFVPKNYGLLGTEMFSSGAAFDAIRLRGGGSSFPPKEIHEDEKSHYLEMDGLAVGKQYLKHVPGMIERILKKTKLTMGKIDLLIFHQANLRLIQVLMSRLKLGMEKTFTNVEVYGNTSDASVALALCEAVEKGRIKRGGRVLLAGVGAGMTFTTSVLRWY